MLVSVKTYLMGNGVARAVSLGDFIFVGRDVSLYEIHN